MTRRALAALGMAAAVAALSPSAAQAKPDPCEARGKTIVANSVARVYIVGKAGERTSFVCRYRARGHRRLVRDRPATSNARGAKTGKVALLGRFVFFDRVGCPEFGNCAHLIRVVDLRSGDVVRRYRSQDDFVWFYPARGGVFVVVRQDGPGAVNIVLVGEGGRRLLDSGLNDNLPPFSVAVARDHVYWMRDGMPQSAPLR